MPKLSHTVDIVNPKLRKKCLLEVYRLFFIGMIHMDLENYYKLNFALMQYHKYSLTEIENLCLWDVYVTLPILRGGRTKSKQMPKTDS